MKDRQREEQGLIQGEEKEEKQTEDLNEELLDAWLKLSMVVSNRRLTESLPYNEALVCHILYMQEKEGKELLTATDLCNETRMLKSLMNATLNSLERKGMTQRIRSTSDRRQVFVKLKDERKDIYLKEHERILKLVDEIICSVGEEEIKKIIPVLYAIMSSVQEITE